MSTPAGNLSGTDGGGASSGADSSSSTPSAAPGGEPSGGLSQSGYNEMFGFSSDDMASLDAPVTDPAAVAAEAPAATEAAPPAATEAAPAPAPAEGDQAPAPAVAQPDPGAAAPAAATSQPTDIFSPLLEHFDTPEQGVDNAEKFLTQLETYDAGASRSLLNAIFDSKKPVLTAWALQEMGFQPDQIPALQEKAATISEWLSKGGELPAADAGLPQFPQADEFGVVTVTPELAKILGDENLESLDLSKPGDKAAYQAAKQVFDRSVQDLKAQRESDRTARETALQTETAKADQRVQEFGQGRVKTLNETFAGLKLDYADDKDAVSDTFAMAQGAVMRDAELHRLDAEGERLAREGGSRLALVQQQMDERIKQHINDAVTRMNNRVLNAARAERGARATDPVLPAGVKTIAAGAAAVPNPPPQQGPQTVDSAIKDFSDPAWLERELGK